LNQPHQNPVRVLSSRSAAEHRCVTALERQGGDVDGHIGPGLVDDTDHTERHAHLADLDAVGQAAAAHHLADRVGEQFDLGHGVGERADAGLIQGQPVQ